MQGKVEKMGTLEKKPEEKLKEETGKPFWNYEVSHFPSFVKANTIN